MPSSTKTRARTLRRSKEEEIFSSFSGEYKKEVEKMEKAATYYKKLFKN